MKRYGNNYVLAEIPTPVKNKQELNRLADDFAKMAANPRNWKQRDKLLSDEIHIRLWAEKGLNLSLFIRQYTGHKYQPEKVNGKYPIKWVSEFVIW